MFYARELLQVLIIIQQNDKFTKEHKSVNEVSGQKEVKGSEVKNLLQAIIGILQINNGFKL